MNMEQYSTSGDYGNVVLYNQACVTSVEVTPGRRGWGKKTERKIAVKKFLEKLYNRHHCYDSWLGLLGMCHATKTPVKCHRRTSEAVFFPAISRCDQDDKNHSH